MSQCTYSLSTSSNNCRMRCEYTPSSANLNIWSKNAPYNNPLYYITHILAQINLKESKRKVYMEISKYKHPEELVIREKLYPTYRCNVEKIHYINLTKDVLWIP